MEETNYEKVDNLLEEEKITKIVQSELAKQKKSVHPLLVALMAALLGFGSGYGGGLLATRQEVEPTPVIQATSQPVIQTVTETKQTNELSIKEISTIAAPSVVEITVDVQTTSYGFFGGVYNSTAAGSGVILTSDGYIITNNHVVDGGSKISVKLFDGAVYEAELVGKDLKSDIAVIKIDAKDLIAAQIGDSAALQVGETAVVIGNPLGTLGGTVTNGIISALDREIVINQEAMNLIQTNAAINSGNSGGGLFNGQGQLIGIVNAKDSGTSNNGTLIEGLGFAIPINDAVDVANQLIENGYVKDRATIGVILTTITQDYGNYKAGLYISEIVEGSAADTAGLQPRDQIIGFDGETINSYQDLSKLIRKKEVGDEVVIRIKRDGEEIDYNLTLGTAQSN